MIQVLTYGGKEEKLKGNDVIVNKLHDAQSLDEFEINVIDLKDENIWRNENNSINTIDTIADFESLSKMIATRKTSSIIILFPQNITFYYRINYSLEYTQSSELKNMISNMKTIIQYLYNYVGELNILYENTKTKIDNNEISASFYFNEEVTNPCTQSVKSKKLTTIKNNDIILSTLNIISYDQLISFLREIHLIEEKENVPEWIKEEKMFDDDIQLKIIEEKTAIIKNANSDIENAMDVIRQNERYKSILYTSGDELVDVIFEILQDMLGCDLSDFNDEKKEDFNFELSDKVVIGEIKGITTNVKNANVSQLDTHVQNYIDNHSIDASSIVSLLVIDHQRNKPLCEREKVHQNAIDLANRNKSLIIETITLLKMYERYLNSTLSREKIIEILTTTAGLLTIDEDE